MTRIILMLASAWCVATPAAAKEYGQLGTVFPVIEPDLLRVIEARLNNLQSTGAIDQMNLQMAKKAEAKVRRPTPVAGISSATAPRSWMFDPSIVIDHEIRDQKRNLISPAGRRINPLDYVVVKTPLVFIDGDDPQEMKWALARFSDTAKLIMVSGAPLEAMTTHQRRFYFDQNGSLTTKFGIRHTPAVVEQAGKVMKVTEFVMGRALK